MSIMEGKYLNNLCKCGHEIVFKYSAIFNKEFQTR